MPPSDRDVVAAKLRKAHRLMLEVYGELPLLELDHPRRQVEDRLLDGISGCSLAAFLGLDLHLPMDAET